MAETLADRIGAALEAEGKRRRFGLYDYTNYPGDAHPFVVRNEETGKTIFRTEERDEAKAMFERLERQALGVAALKAMQEPDEAEGGPIETAGMFALPFDQILDGEPYKQANSARLCWQAMIDQAIKEAEA